MRVRTSASTAVLQLTDLQYTALQLLHFRNTLRLRSWAHFIIDEDMYGFTNPGFTHIASTQTSEFEGPQLIQG